MIHDLKTDPEVFDAVARGEKTFEIRKDDRGFQVGDTLILRRTRYTGKQMHFGDPLEYTGEKEVRRVTHLLRGPLYGLAEGWVILSISKDLGKDEVLFEALESVALPCGGREVSANPVTVKIEGSGSFVSDATKAKLSERKTVHEWLNANGVPSEEMGKPICLLRRLRITLDLFAEMQRDKVRLDWMVRNVGTFEFTFRKPGLSVDTTNSASGVVIREVVDTALKN